MTGIYYNGVDGPDMVAAARAAGMSVRESATTDGWQRRARSSGGFSSPPLGVFWHHTASSTSPANDLAYMIDGCDDAPVGNWLVDRAGDCWPIAAGASNCAGQGGPATFTRGTIPADAGNTRGWQIEAANAGTGEEPWPAAQVDAFFGLSNVLNALAGNSPRDVITHALGAGDGWTDRKIDPATAAAVAGPWVPRSVTSSGTWSLYDIANECAARSGDQEDDMTDDQLRAITDRLDRIAAAQQADFERDGTFGPKADQGISQRSLIYDQLGSIGTKLDLIIDAIT